MKDLRHSSLHMIVLYPCTKFYLYYLNIKQDILVQKS